MMDSAKQLVPDMLLSVVSHGQGRLVRNLLADLRQQVGVRFEVVVTLNLPESEEFLEEFRDLPIQVVRNSEPKGFGANHNAAFRLCRHKWFVVLNPDIRIPVGRALADLVLAETGETVSASMVAPAVFNSAGVLEDAVRRNLTPLSLVRRVLRIEKTRRGADILDEKRFFWYAGMALAVDAGAYRMLGGFDEKLFLYCEDYDLCARMYKAGLELCRNDRVRFIHDAQRDSRRSFKYLRMHLTSLLKVWTSSIFWYVVVKDFNK
jgi:N-acetylglucosaminyl-diphospho-decaprenol L-rhamnosyltransferase